MEAVREIRAKPIFKDVGMCVCVVFCFMKRDMKFTRGSCCVARDEFLVTFKGDHILINMYISYLQRVIVGHCIALRYIV